MTVAEVGRYPVDRCPRCRERAPLDTLSRTSRGAEDEATMICAGCGTEEAFEQLAGGPDAVTARSAWPVRRPRKPAPGWRDTWDDHRSNRSAQPTPAPTPREVPDLRLHLLEKWTPGGRFDTVVGRMVHGDVVGAADWERSLLRQASLWWVSEEMANLTAAASASIPDDVTPRDLTVPGEQSYGMAVLATPWQALDANEAERPVRVDVIVWGPTMVEGRQALSLSFYRYLDFAVGLNQRELRLAIESGGIMDGRPELSRGGAGDRRAFGLTGGSWAYIGRSDWPFDRAAADTSDFPAIDADATKHASYVEDRRWFCAFSLLVNHRLSQQETVYAPRAVRRRGDRAGVSDRDVSNVRLIRLRQPNRAAGSADSDVERRNVEWTHRWIVGGHTAWRRCGPEKNDRRLVYIAPFVKGPDDKPLVVKTDVRMWVR